MRDQHLDEIDRLFARLEPADPPADFMARLLTRVEASPLAARQPLRRLGLACAGAYLLALALLAVLAHQVGASIAHNGTSTLLSALLDDAQLFTDQPGDYLTAIAASIPWLEVAGLALDLAALMLATHFLLRSSKAGHGPAPLPAVQAGE